QEPGVVQADAMGEEPPHVLAEWRIEAGVGERGPERLLLLAGGDVGRGESLGLLGGGALAEVDQVDRGPSPLDQVLQRLVERRLAILELERDGPLSAAYGGDLPPGEVVDALLDGGGI